MGKIMAVKKLEPGNILSDNVLSIGGKILLGKGIELTPRHISLLNTWDIQNVFVEAVKEDVDEDASLEEPVKPLDSGKYQQFITGYRTIEQNVDGAFSLIRQSRIIPVQNLKETAGEIQESIQVNNFEIMNYLLAGEYEIEKILSRHAVMVAYLSGIIARQMKWEEKDVQGVALASLLHDIGSLIANDRSTAYQEAHIAETAGLLKNAAGITGDVILGIVQHRENMDGTGIPTGSKGRQIHPYAQIIAVADRFHNFAYTGAYANPFPVLDLLSKEMYGKFDTAVCQNFIARLKDSLILNRVVLSDGRPAEIIFFNRSSYAVPVVKTLDNEIIDLDKRRELTIRQIILPQ